MKRNYHKWTNLEDQVLIGLYEDGVKSYEIAQTLNLSKNSVINRISILKKKGLITTSQNFIWDEKKEKELVKILQKNEGNLRKGFKQFAEIYNIPYTSVEYKYYNKSNHSIRIKDKYPIFSVFGRYRASNNSKIYNRQNSKGHTLWTTIKKLFKF